MKAKLRKRQVSTPSRSTAQLADSPRLGSLLRPSTAQAVIGAKARIVEAPTGNMDAAFSPRSLHLFLGKTHAPAISTGYYAPPV
jgi:hypothetical protein